MPSCKHQVLFRFCNSTSQCRSSGYSLFASEDFTGVRYMIHNFSRIRCRLFRLVKGECSPFQEWHAATGRGTFGCSLVSRESHRPRAFACSCSYNARRRFVLPNLRDCSDRYGIQQKRSSLPRYRSSFRRDPPSTATRRRKSIRWRSFADPSARGKNEAGPKAKGTRGLGPQVDGSLPRFGTIVFDEYSREGVRERYPNAPCVSRRSMRAIHSFLEGASIGFPFTALFDRSKISKWGCDPSIR